MLGVDAYLLVMALGRALDLIQYHFLAMNGVAAFGAFKKNVLAPF
jgi:hypothetical protein